MGSWMNDFVISYLHSQTGIVINVILFLFFIPFFYKSLLEKKSASTGKHNTEGKITWSEYGLFAKDRSDLMVKEALVSYSYKVNGKLYVGELGASVFRQAQLARQNPEGSALTVYYSIDDPSFSKGHFPPSLLDIFVLILLRFCIAICMLNIAPAYIWWLINLN
jgi:hypothetical protein